MTSQSHRKRRTIRWNILRTVTTELRDLTFLAATLLFVAGLQAFGAGSGDDVPTPSPSSELPRAGRSSALADTDPTLRQSRELFHSLRATWHDTARTGSTAPFVGSPTPPAVPPMPTAAQVGTAAMAAETVQLAGVVRIPDLLPTPTAPLPTAPLPTDSGLRRISEGCDARPKPTGRFHKIQKFTGLDGTRFKRNLRKGTTKVRKKASRAGGKLIEFYDPELERFDPEDYDMPLLLVAASDETEAEEVEADTSDASGEQVGLLARKLSDIKPTLDYAWGKLEDGDLPVGFHDRMDNGPYEETFAPRTVVQWAPTNLWYHPLYFQDVGLERYGHTRRPWVQPFVSSGRFFGQVVGLPYQMVLHPPKSREFVLGYYRPGEWAPKKRYQIPFNEEAAATEFLWVTGFILLIP